MGVENLFLSFHSPNWRSCPELWTWYSEEAHQNSKSVAASLILGLNYWFTE